MSARRFLGRIRQEITTAVQRRNFSLPEAEPVISFTFDDFPRSALHVGGAILRSYEARGTYYAAMGLVNLKNGMGPLFCEEDLRVLLRDGHELGSHTFGHVSARSVSASRFYADVEKGKDAIERVTTSDGLHPFSYPYGHLRVSGKRRIGALFSSSRGIVPGVNRSPLDLNLLRANSLYAQTFDITSVQFLIAETVRLQGHLIFYTHDISETPSAFGSTPGQFEQVVQMAAKSGVAILPIGEALSNRANL